MQLVQSGMSSTAAYVPGASVWPHKVVTGPLLGTFGVRWMRPPVFRLTDSSLTCWTPIASMMGDAPAARPLPPRGRRSALFGLGVGDLGGSRFAHALFLQGLVRLGSLDRRSGLLSWHLKPP